MVCDILDFKCIFMNELIGSTILTMIFLTIVYFVVASKVKIGFDTTIAFAFPVIMIGGLFLTGFSVIYAVVTILAGIMLAWIFNSIIGNQ